MRDIYGLQGPRPALATLLADLETEYGSVTLMNVEIYKDGCWFWALVRLPSAIEPVEFEQTVSKLSRSVVISVE